MDSIADICLKRPGHKHLIFCENNIQKFIMFIFKWLTEEKKITLFAS